MQSQSLSNNAEAFVPDEDVTETLEDGRTVQIAVKGTPIPMVEARKLGLVKDVKADKAEKTEGDKTEGEKGSTGGTANKSRTPNSNK